MRKPTWMDLGIAVIGLFLVCGAAQEAAQTQGTYGTGGSGEATTQDSMDLGPQPDEAGGAGDATAQGSTGTGQGTEPAAGTGQTTGTGQGADSQQASDSDSQQRVEIARLRVEVARLQQELARTRAQLAQAGSATQGTGGAGTGGTGNVGAGGSGSSASGDSNAEAPQGATGGGAPTEEGVGGGGRAAGAQAAQPDTANQGYAVANVIYTGRIRSVSPQQLVLEFEGGSSNTLALARDVRVFRGRQQVSLQSLREGTLVRASADLYARGNPVSQIEVIPTAAQKAP